ncbi:hypothetical protein T265_03057 [Opisthorchis viverrini]|uniref:Uncharacterized protein n=1 Tax=Opisthorchis viverrini TaxID=6198 RepID=A0A074ZT43_OPIVI|nr:hypothetical protein T265_03057 [Opisthorchis viverrini]KER30583.1 hypothetical protein T265_03057 [Opisthorchis viverrini]
MNVPAAVIVTRLFESDACGALSSYKVKNSKTFFIDNPSKDKPPCRKGSNSLPRATARVTLELASQEIFVGVPKRQIAASDPAP